MSEEERKPLLLQGFLPRPPMNTAMDTGDSSDDQEEAPPVPESENFQRLRGYLNHPMKITLTDERVVVGTFHCIDKFRNIILHSCQETTRAGTIPFFFIYSFFPFIFLIPFLLYVRDR